MPPWPQTVVLVVIFVIGLLVLAGESSKIAETVGAVMVLAPVLMFIVLVGLQAVRS